MSDMNVRSEGVDVEQIMRQIRARIREKRGVDYTEAEIQQLATAKLERFLDPRGVRSDLVEQYRRHRVVSPSPANYEFGETTLFETHRGLLRLLRRLFRPILKLFFNPDKITSALHIQAEVNEQAEARLRRIEEREPLHYEIVHNLTLEVTRLGIEVHNLRMRVESLSSRLDFDERRARSLEGVVAYRPDALQKSAPPEARSEASDGDSEGGEGERRRRRRRRRRRPGQTQADARETDGADGRAESSTPEQSGAADAGASPEPPADTARAPRAAEPPRAEPAPFPDTPPTPPEGGSDPSNQ